MPHLESHLVKICKNKGDNVCQNLLEDLFSDMVSLDEKKQKNYIYLLVSMILGCTAGELKIENKLILIKFITRVAVGREYPDPQEIDPDPRKSQSRSPKLKKNSRFIFFFEMSN